MTKYYEVKRRDGPARIGRFILDEYVETPFIIQTEGMSPIINMGSIWREETEISDLKGKLIILPFDPLFHDLSKDLDLPKGIVIDPEEGISTRADLYVIAYARRLLMNPRNLVRTIIKVREEGPPDTALYAPAVATPENVAILIYLGVDIFDDVFTTISGYQDRYLTTEGEFWLDELTEFPCLCDVCQHTHIDDLKRSSRERRSKLLSDHNRFQLILETKKAKQSIRRGQMREYMEKQCRSSSFSTACLRIIDEYKDYLEKRIPIARNSILKANTMESFNRIEIKRFSDRIKDRYRSNAKIELILPCSAKKPYSISRTHRIFIDSLGKYRRYVHEVILTSPLGVVPRELELTYPAAHYDIPVTGHWSEEEKEFVCECLESYLRSQKYDRIIAHVDGAYKEIIEIVADELNIEILYTSTGKTTSDGSLRKLRETVRGIAKPNDGRFPEGKSDSPLVNRHYTGRFPERKSVMIKAIADYQFGVGAGEMLIGKSRILGSFPRYEVRDREKLATLVPEYGLLALTIAGAKKMMDFDSYYVRIDDFVPKGSILAPGVTDADHRIRTNDEVIIIGEGAFGVGRAVMNGWEMSESSRGVAVDVRYIEER